MSRDKKDIRELADEAIECLHEAADCLYMAAGRLRESADASGYKVYRKLSKQATALAEQTDAIAALIAE